MIRPTRSLVLLSILACLPLPAQEVIAHRGFSARAPENTLAAFHLGWESDADACELDLHLSSDGQIVVLHDKDTLRTCGVKHVAAATPASVLTALDAGSWKDPKWRGERLPTLEQALTTLPPGRQRFFLEIKCGPEVVPPLRALLKNWRDRASQFAIISFNAEVCAAAKNALPWLPVYQLASWKIKGGEQPNDLDAIIAQSKRNGLDGLNLGRDWPWSEEMVSKIRAAGLAVYVYTVNDTAEARKFAELEVNGITTDDPVALKRAISTP